MPSNLTILLPTLLLLLPTLLLLLPATPPAWASTITIDGSVRDRRFDGHGGLSAGASSRLLFDYPEPQRSDILDFLWRPNFGAQLHICKVEIGGDVQSTDGTEASHKHTRYDLNYERGYEWWLMAEAKKRNPDVLTYALSWGVPGWVGGGVYFSQDNIGYQVDFLVGARSVYNITIDYLGVWNERPWGNPTYIKDLRAALDSAGFNTTKIVGADGWIPSGQIAALAADPVLSAAEPILGTHYPCANDQPASFWELTPAKTYWANEDFSTVADWAGGGCWGRSLSQNWVKLNATSTISWSTIWSVYPSWPYYGNGLMYAYTPWSASYTVNPTIWTSAHTTQFVQPGWNYLGKGGRGLLPNGGSWVSYVPPASRGVWNGASRSSAPGDDNMRPHVEEAGAGDFTLVLEKLEGDCLRCQVPATAEEDVTIVLQGGLEVQKSLAVWLTNKSHWFVRLPDLYLVDGSVTITMPRDTTITLTTTTGQAKGTAAPPPDDGPFPVPYSDNYDARPVHRPALYHSDNTGSFEIVRDGDQGYLLQAQPLYPQGTEWSHNYDPITALGSGGWADYSVSVDVTIVAPAPAVALLDESIIFPHPTQHTLAGMDDDPISSGAYGGVCVRQLVQFDSGYCFLVGAGLVGAPNSSKFGWVVQEGTGRKARAPGTILAAGPLNATFNLSAWHRVSLEANNQLITASLDGAVITTVKSGGAFPSGLACLRSGWHFSYFDNLAINGRASPSNTLFLSAIPTGCGRKDFGSYVGAQLLVGPRGLILLALGRFGATLSAHTLAVIDETNATLAEEVLLPGNTTDIDGFRYVYLPVPLVLSPGATVYLVSMETKDSLDPFCDVSSSAFPRANMLANFTGAYYQNGWQTQGPGHLYGVVNALVSL